MFTEMLNDKWDEWKELLQFQHARVLQRNNKLADIDVAFIEGAVTSAKDETEVKEIRANSRRVVTVGSCATTGLPSGARNQFDPDQKTCIRYLIEKFGQTEMVKSIPEVIEVDDKVPGCPMNETIFLQVLEKYLKEFGII